MPLPPLPTALHITNYASACNGLSSQKGFTSPFLLFALTLEIHIRESLPRIFIFCELNDFLFQTLVDIQTKFIQEKECSVLFNLILSKILAQNVNSISTYEIVESCQIK